MIIVALVLLGLCFGSFVNALVWRLYEQTQPRKKQAKGVNLSITTGRSVCPTCTHVLSAKDLVPVLSWLSLRGKCRYCRKPISWQYPALELLTAGLFVLSFLVWPYDFETLGLLRLVVWLAIVVGSMALLVYDLRWMIMPNKIVFPLIGLAGVHALTEFTGSRPLTDTVLLIFSSVAIASGVFYILFQISGGKWIGGGDVKFGVVYGLLLAHPLESALVIFVASLIGCLLILPGLITHKQHLQSKLPFGPLLIFGMITTYLWGSQIVDWYVATFIYL